MSDALATVAEHYLTDPTLMGGGVLGVIITIATLGGSLIGYAFGVDDE